jgi:hypothetical protein
MYPTLYLTSLEEIVLLLASGILLGPELAFLNAPEFKIESKQENVTLEGIHDTVIVSCY